MPESVKKKLLPALLVLTVAVLFAGCSGEETKSVPATAGPTAAPSPDSKAPPAVGGPTTASSPRPTNEAAAEKPAMPTADDHPTPVPTHESLPIKVQLGFWILAINDFHGHIATTSDHFGGVGRADFLAANIAAARAEVENSIFVSAGDLIGASPLISALFHDEPTIEAMNLMGL